MAKKVTIQEIWSIDKIKAISFYKNSGKDSVKISDYYAQMLIDSLSDGSLSSNENDIVMDPSFIHRLLANANLPHLERLTRSLYEAEGGLLSLKSLRDLENTFEDKQDEKINSNENEYAIYESKFRFFDYGKSSEDEIIESYESGFFKYSKLTIKGSLEYIQSVPIIPETKTLVLENNNLNDVSEISFKCACEEDRTTIENLYLNNNNINDITSFLTEGIKHLDLSCNKIEEFGSRYLPLSIRHINLSFNLGLKSIILDDIIYLEYLDLSNTSIQILECVPKTVQNLILNNCEKLKEVYLESTFINFFSTNSKFRLNMEKSIIDVLLGDGNSIILLENCSQIFSTKNIKIE